MTHSRHQALRTYPHRGSGPSLIGCHLTGASALPSSLVVPFITGDQAHGPVGILSPAEQLRRPCLGWRRRGHVLTIRKQLDQLNKDRKNYKLNNAYRLQAVNNAIYFLKLEWDN